MFRHALSLLCGMLLLMAALPLSAASIPPLEGLEAMRRSFAGISDFSAEIVQEKQLTLLRKKLVMHGRVRFRKPDLFLMELDPPYASRLLMRDSIVEQAVDRSGKPNRIPLPPEQGLRRWFDNLSKPVTTIPDGMKVRADLSNGLYTLAIAPPGSGQVRELILAFREDGTLRRLVIEERSGDRSSITFRRLKRNQGLTERDFRLE